MAEYMTRILIESLFSYGLIKENDKEIYHYSAQVLIEKIIGLSVILVFSIIWGIVLETILFLFCFSGIRKHTGGFHANAFWECFISSVGVYIIYVKVIYPILANNINANMLFLVVAVIIIGGIGSINHPNMGWSKKEHNDSKMISRIMVVIEVSCIIIFYFLGMTTKYVLFMSFGVILSAFLLVLGKFVGQEVKYE